MIILQDGDPIAQATRAGKRKCTGAGAEVKTTAPASPAAFSFMRLCRRVLFYIRLFSGTTPAAVFFLTGYFYRSMIWD